MCKKRGFKTGTAGSGVNRTAVKMKIRTLLESVRCAKHNLLDRPSFNMSFKDGCYYVRTADNNQLRFRRNPYQAFYQVTAGYLRDSTWPLTAGMCVIDAGACDGEFALYASRCVGPTGRVLALEPDPESFKCLRETFDLNGGVPPNVALLPVGLWKHSRELAFSGGNHLTSHLIEVADGTTGHSDSLSILVQSLSDLVSRYGLTRLDFVKMDIEGAEIEAIEGAGSVLSVFKPRFAIASYHRRNGRPTADKLEQLFRESGYNSATGFPEHMTTYASPATQEVSAGCNAGYLCRT